MIDIDFYQLTVTPLEKALPRLLERIQLAGYRSVVVTKSQERAEELDHLLWTYTPLSFLPHGCSRETSNPPGINLHPIWITTRSERPNEAEILILTDGATLPNSGQNLKLYQRCLYLLESNTPPGHLEALKNDHINSLMTFWQQTPESHWKKV